MAGRASRSRTPDRPSRKGILLGMASNTEPMNKDPEDIRSVFDGALGDLRRVREEFTPQLAPRETGRVKRVSTGIALVPGLPGAGYDEQVIFPGRVPGIAFNVDEENAGVIEDARRRAGNGVRPEHALCLDFSSRLKIQCECKIGQFVVFENSEFGVFISTRNKEEAGLKSGVIKCFIPDGGHPYHRCAAVSEFDNSL